MRRNVRTVVAAALVLATASPPAAWAGSHDRSPTVRPPGYVRDSGRPLGAHDNGSPITHVVIVMQENHSFDEYFGMLPREGQPKADGFRFDAQGRPINSNPTADGGTQVVQPHDQPCS